MARRRFFVNGIHSGHAELTGEEAAHLTRVLRVEAGQQYEISDNRRAYLAEVESARKNQVVFRIMEVLDPEPGGIEVTLLAALIKFDHFELLIEKATELGAAAIVPVRTARSEHGLEKAALKRIERWKRIAIEASEQSRRTHLPHVADPVDFRDALSCEASIRLFLDEDREALPILRALPASRSSEDSVAMLAGPEGGWTGDERKAAITAGWTPASLGRRVLRTETASIAGLAVVQAAYAENEGELCHTT
jgi:16S rRNA (uracil1498-N3)-methyltransferase